MHIYRIFLSVLLICVPEFAQAMHAETVETIRDRCRQSSYIMNYYDDDDTLASFFSQESMLSHFEEESWDAVAECIIAGCDGTVLLRKKMSKESFFKLVFALETRLVRTNKIDADRIEGFLTEYKRHGRWLLESVRKKHAPDTRINKLLTAILDAEVPVTPVASNPST